MSKAIHHTAVSTVTPIPAVKAMANAPQNVRRAVAFTTFGPPTFAPIAPSGARKKQRRDRNGVGKKMVRTLR